MIPRTVHLVLKSKGEVTMPLIDYKAIRKLFKEEYKKTVQLIHNGDIRLDTVSEGFRRADKVIRELPNADAVEVVRCKDCKYSSFIKSCSKYECSKGCGALKFSNDFCSYGERAER